MIRGSGILEYADLGGEPRDQPSTTYDQRGAGRLAGEWFLGTRSLDARDDDRERDKDAEPQFSGGLSIRSFAFSGKIVSSMLMRCIQGAPTSCAHR